MNHRKQSTILVFLEYFTLKGFY